MLNLLSFHEKNTKFFYYIVLIGAGGTGGYAVQRITKMMNAFNNVRTYLMIADPDVIEKKNLLRQPFISEDITLKKADVLAKRYGTTYGIKIGSYSDTYVETIAQLKSLFSHTDYMNEKGQFIQKVLIGAVDNDFSRKIMNDYFQTEDDLIYIDAGIEGVYLPSGEPTEWSLEEKEEHLESGYSGQVVVGVKKSNKIILSPLQAVYPIDNQDSIPPSHNCGVEPYHPQRMITNEMAAFQITAVLNEMFAQNSILVHYCNFSSRTGNSRPVFIEESLLTQ
ncbi:ThiF family adenylyltransferase [Paenibacillus larvae]